MRKESPTPRGSSALKNDSAPLSFFSATHPTSRERAVARLPSVAPVETTLHRTTP
jgi:hypothetical protein